MVKCYKKELCCSLLYCDPKFDHVNFKKISILGQSPHIWIISLKEANRFPVLSFGTKVLPFNCYSNSLAAFECVLRISKLPR